MHLLTWSVYKYKIHFQETKLTEPTGPMQLPCLIFISKIIWIASIEKFGLVLQLASSHSWDSCWINNDIRLGVTGWWSPVIHTKYNLTAVIIVSVLDDFNYESFNENGVTFLIQCIGCKLERWLCFFPPEFFW